MNEEKHKLLLSISIAMETNKLLQFFDREHSEILLFAGAEAFQTEEDKAEIALMKKNPQRFCIIPAPDDADWTELMLEFTSTLTAASKQLLELRLNNYFEPENERELFDGLEDELILWKAFKEAWLYKKAQDWLTELELPKN